MRTQQRSATEISVKVSFEGRTESFTYIAAKSLFGNKHEYSGCIGMKEVFKQVKEGTSDYGVIALESSSHGSIHGVYDELLNMEGSVVIVAELGQSEEHCFCTDAQLISSYHVCSEVHGHPVDLACCSEFLDDTDSKRAKRGLPDIQRIPSTDSVDACISARNATSTGVYAAAIASKGAATANGLIVAVRGIGNDLNAETRYVVIARSSGAHISHDPLCIAPEASLWTEASPRGTLKASIALGLRNIPGALFKMTSCFAFRDINIVKIESRPSTMGGVACPSSLLTSSRRHWDLIYYLDYEPSDSPVANQALLAALREYCLWVRELGFYYAGLHPVEPAAAEWKNLLEVVGY